MRGKGFTVWFTGLPCSGKSTLSKRLHQHLKELGYPAEILDGDEVRKRLTKGLDFSRDGRNENVRRIAYVANLISRVGGVAITAAISPYAALRADARKEISNFIEVYVNCPLEVCIERDVKGHYAKAKRGEIQNFTGISDPYEPPTKPEVVVQTNVESPDESIKKIVEYLAKSRYIEEEAVRRNNKDNSMM
ncbi:MAG: adenylyl-sulfate kinase [Nitrospirales bacterium]|nr:adenylyl-sulfate kinase [Nitrospira sp.]MDR4502060.1 adenylyl-sulfate kinase [Nitrospirales bacterium]